MQGLGGLQVFALYSRFSKAAQPIPADNLEPNFTQGVCLSTKTKTKKSLYGL